MHHQRFIVAIILIIVQTVFCGCNSAIRNKTEHFTGSSEHTFLSQTQRILPETEAKTRFIEGNGVEFLDDGKYAFEQWLNLLSGAQHTIYLQTYYLEDTGQTARLIEMLKKNAGQLPAL